MRLGDEIFHDSVKNSRFLEMKMANRTAASASAVIWDVDGTLVDTAQLHYQAWCVLAGEIGKPFTRPDFNATFGWRNPEIIPKIFGLHGEQEIAALGARKEALYRAEARKGVELLPGARALIAGLKAVGEAQAIGSSAPRANLELILEICGLVDIFQAMVSMEDVHRGKPHPDVFLAAAERLGIAPQRCVVIEDAPVGIQAAKAGGMRAIGVTFVGHHSAEKLHAAGADRVVASLDQLTAADVMAMLRNASHDPV
jgi:beta-phosphoglucomutase